MWIKQDNELSFTASEIQALDTIPAGNWLLKYSPTKGFFLEETPNFKFPKKIYGDSEIIAKRYLNTFANQKNNLGILLTGLKGTGKSVTAKLTCHLSNLPVILITEHFTGDGFKSFLSNITQEVIVFIDEFEKVYYDDPLQNSFLSILDGIFEGKKMFIFTSNEKNKINHYMLNRPGRVHYLREYAALDLSIINDVIDDNLVLKENKDGLLEVLNILSNVTMDMLISLIKEMNLYKESARESIRYLNLKPDRTSFEIEGYYKGLKLGYGDIDYHPLTTEEISIRLYCRDFTKYVDGASNHDNVVAEVNSWKRRNSLPVDEVFDKANISVANEEDVKCEVVDTEESPDGSATLTKTRKAFMAELDSDDKPGGYINFTLIAADCKVSFEKDSVTIEDKFGNNFQFKKRTYYSFSF